MKLNDSIEDYSICKDSLCNGEKMVSSNCGHLFHEACLFGWLKTGYVIQDWIDIFYKNDIVD